MSSAYFKPIRLAARRRSNFENLDDENVIFRKMSMTKVNHKR